MDIHAARCEKLFEAVLVRAFLDATDRSGFARVERDRARTWLTTFSTDFIEVVEMAGRNPTYVYERATILRDNDWQYDRNHPVFSLRAAA